MTPGNEWFHWRSSLTDKGIAEDLIAVYGPYIDRLISNRVPVIFEFEHLALLLGLTKQYLASAVNASAFHYRRFTIPKRRGGSRVIEAPYPALLHCQRWIYRNILLSCPVHDAAHGFVPGRSIVTNARQHFGAKSLLTMDLRDFFHSITINQVMQTFLEIGYANNVAYYLASLCTLRGRLPQGAATSPMLSNIIAKHCDNRLSRLASAYGITYTRYADDLSFSGGHIPISFLDIVRAIVSECGFSINDPKTKMVSAPRPLMITGLILKDNRLTIPRQMRREISRDMHFIQQYGYLSHASNRKIRDPFYLDRLIGKCNFWLQAEPNNQKVAAWRRTLVKLSRET